MTKSELLSAYNKVLVENEELKKKVETLKGVITQAWFTDVEEKDKQIEHLRQKVEELSTTEPTEEELNWQLNRLFMEKQINPKDIEFDGDKLVDSVEEAASKLKSLKDHNDGKVFDAYGGGSFKSGLACPKCGSELYYNNPNMVLTSYPPKRSVECKNCKHTDYVY
jgi:redox-regulated HSP33 family molecular chaperone